MREMLVYWRKHEKVEKEQRRKAEKEAMEQHKLNEEMREVRVVVYACMCLLVLSIVHFTGKKTAEEAQLPNYSDRTVCPFHGKEAYRY